MMLVRGDRLVDTPLLRPGHRRDTLRGLPCPPLSDLACERLVLGRRHSVLLGDEDTAGGLTGLVDVRGHAVRVTRLQ